MTLAAIGLGVAAIAVIAVAFVPATLDVLRALDAGIDRLERLLDVGAINAPLASLVTEVIDGIKEWVSGAASIVVSAIASTATIVLLAVFLLFFLVTDADRAIAWTLQLAEPRQREQIHEATVTARRRLGRSLRETGTRAAAIGLVGFVVALVLGLPARSRSRSSSSSAGSSRCSGSSLRRRRSVSSRSGRAGAWRRSPP